MNMKQPIIDFADEINLSDKECELLKDCFEIIEDVAPSQTRGGTSFPTTVIDKDREGMPVAKTTMAKYLYCNFRNSVATLAALYGSYKAAAAWVGAGLPTWGALPAVILVVGGVFAVKGKATKVHDRIPSVVAYVLYEKEGANGITEDELLQHVNAFMKENNQPEITQETIVRTNNELNEAGVITIDKGMIKIADFIKL